MEEKEIQINTLFTRRDQIQGKMNSILVKNLTTLSGLSRLPESDINEWNALRIASNKLADEICSTILNVEKR